MDIPNDTTHSVFVDAIRGIVHLMDDPSISEIMVNRPDEVWVKQGGAMHRVDSGMDEVRLRTAIQSLARIENKDVAESSANSILDARIGSYRVACVLRPTAVDGHAMCIRKHTSSSLTLDDYRSNGFFDPFEDAERTVELGEDRGEFLRKIVRGRKNILVAGGTDSGKTTLLNALIAEIPDTERVISIEDTVELHVRAPNKVRLLANKQSGIEMRDLVRLSLRMRPDRIVVGEVRGSEAYDLLQAFNTGHDGGFATIHASNARLALMRLESLVMQEESARMGHEAIAMQIASTLNYVVHLKTVGGLRRLSELVEIAGFENGKYVLRDLLKENRNEN